MINARKIITFLVPSALLGIALLGGSVLVLRVFFLSVMVIGVSYLSSKLSLRNLRVELEVPPDRLQVGDSFQHHASVSNGSHLPKFWLQLHDSGSLSESREVTIAGIGGKGIFSWDTTFHCTRRGRFYVGPVTVKSGDLLGLFHTGKTFGHAHELIVYPATIELPLLKFVPTGEIGHGTGFQSVTHISPNASSVRELISGDSLHYIHWRSTARTGKLMVKMFDVDRSHNASKTTWVILDMNEESHFGEGNDATEEQAVTLAASVVKRYLQNGMRVGLMSTSESSPVIMPDRGEAHLWKVLESLALTDADLKTGITDLINNNVDKMRDNPLAVIVGTTATIGLQETIRQMRNKAGSVVVILLDVASFGGRATGTDIARTLTWSGAQVFIIRKGDDLSRTLDSKLTERFAALV